MRAQLVMETISFDRDDPNIYRKIGIGKKSWHQLKPGDIIIPKREFTVSKGKFKPPSYKSGVNYYTEDFVVIISIRNAAVRSYESVKNGLMIDLHRCWDLKEALKVGKIVEEGEYQKSKFKRPIEATHRQWEDRFEIYQ